MSDDYLFICMDGTGAYSEFQYKNDFLISFLSQVARNLGPANCKYLMGPGTLGFTTADIAREALEPIRQFHRKNQTAPIYLAGYSRGGAGMIELAAMCWPIPIAKLFLLDPVSKDMLAQANGVTGNVDETYVMYRDRGIKEYSPMLDTADWADYRDKILCLGGNAFGMNDEDRYARHFMHSANPHPRPGGKRMSKLFNFSDIKNASHGAMGGCPWIERRADEIGYKHAASILNGWLSTCAQPTSVHTPAYSAANLKMVPEVTDAYIYEYMEQRAGRVTPRQYQINIAPMMVPRGF